LTDQVQWQLIVPALGVAYAAFDPEIECPNALPTLSMLKWAGMLGGVSLLVPLWWIWLARSEWESPESKEFVMAFITAGYRKGGPILRS
ncbi:pmp6, partial [Symbiodinium sp. KB8]